MALSHPRQIRPEQSAHYKAMIAAAPFRYEWRDGRKWKIITLPPGGEEWLTSTSAEYDSGDGDEAPTPSPTGAEGGGEVLAGLLEGGS
jgi:hypothetical protein